MVDASMEKVMGGGGVDGKGDGRGDETLGSRWALRGTLTPRTWGSFENAKAYYPVIPQTVTRFILTYYPISGSWTLYSTEIMWYKSPKQTYSLLIYQPKQ